MLTLFLDLEMVMLASSGLRDWNGWEIFGVFSEEIWKEVCGGLGIGGGLALGGLAQNLVLGGTPHWGQNQEGDTSVVNLLHSVRDVFGLSPEYAGGL